MVGVFFDVLRFVFVFWLRSVVALRPHSVRAVVPDRFDRAALHSFLAKCFFFRGGRLLEYKGVAAIVVAAVIGGCSFPA